LTQLANPIIITLMKRAESKEIEAIIIVPTYNERENLPIIVKEIFEQPLKAKIIIVDDNSPDGTGEVAEQIKKRYKGTISVIHRIEQKRSFAQSYLTGIKMAVNDEAEYIILMDADLAHDPKYLQDFLAKLKEVDFVVGSRYINGVSVLNWPIKRLILSRMGNLYAEKITKLKVKDCTSGFLGFRKVVLKHINLDNIKSNGYSFLIELKLKVQQMGYSIGEIPIIFRGRVKGASKMSKKIFFEALYNVIRFRLLG